MDMCKVLDIPFPRLFCEESTPPTRGGENNSVPLNASDAFALRSPHTEEE